jgi:hypothetical protein
MSVARTEVAAPRMTRWSQEHEPPEAAEVKAWELIDAEAGRYMPYRIRGSFRGRALG